MNFQGQQAKYTRLYNESRAWKLLRADRAPLIIAFLQTLFAEESEVPYSRARVALDAELDRCRELGIWETETNAGTYLNRWIRSGWLREMDDTLTKTDAFETALRFCRGLDERETVTTASHLRIVQEAVRDFLVAVSSDPKEKATLLAVKQRQIQKEIDELNSGVVTVLNPAEQRERIREIYQLASVLTGDFRRMEDEIRQLDQELRIRIIEGDAGRGEVLLSVMEKEALLESTDAGSAFDGFFQLLCDQNRSMEFRGQLREILSKPVARHLTPSQQKFLGHLMRELTHESERVFHVRRRTEEGLRTYIESGAARENRAVDLLLGKLERAAVSLGEAKCPPGTPTNISLPVGSVKVASPDKMKLRFPEEKIDTSGIEEEVNLKKPSREMLGHLDTVRIRHVARQTFKALVQHGPMTIASLAELHPLNSGLEELVAHLRVAKAVGAASLESKETIVLRDKQGTAIQASIPTLLLTADLFPEDLKTLTL